MCGSSACAQNFFSRHIARVKNYLHGWMYKMKLVVQRSELTVGSTDAFVEWSNDPWIIMKSVSSSSWLETSILL